ncbi:putative metal-sulfur cluster biosynthesis proteins YuaD [Antarctobacter heliothermus]|uniref:Putative metal-sulfur cluster biosynthesis proteins YuaD n=1 Tax=Antarctobacter heliothermus TaxID=74033 RepID=A0A222DZ57_9RHOB|nr:MOSC domain-containing protein [Antarctobacter heliothermus]ASP18988.1 putative metal-sulfur cluster biosynthesis proteins YuaD [Antarctobacter heliothermus]
MPALKPTDYTATVTWLGVVTNDDRAELLAEVLAAVDLTFEGVAGSVHGGATRESCSRVKSQYSPGTRIRNERQLSIISAEELSEIAAQMGLDRIDPARLGASMVLSGLPDFSFLPPSSRLQAPSGATLTVDMQNRPCQFPAKSIDKVAPGLGKGFKPAANGRRGITASVAREGRVALGDVLRLHIPDQRGWQPA